MANVVVANFGSVISIMCSAFAVVFYFFPSLATTPSNEIDPRNPGAKGIPLKKVYSSVRKIMKDPENLAVLFQEDYVMAIDFVHSIAYLFMYMEEYMTFD